MPMCLFLSGYRMMIGRLLIALFVIQFRFSDQFAHADTNERQPYPLIEFFLSHDCVERDREVTTLIETAALSDDVSPAILLEVYFLVDEARRHCLAGHVTTALAKYDQVDS